MGRRKIVDPCIRGELVLAALSSGFDCEISASGGRWEGWAFAREGKNPITTPKEFISNDQTGFESRRMQF